MRMATAVSRFATMRSRFTAQLTDEIAARVTPAGVRVIESRITHLAYAPEIAQAMLRRQQADAVVAARQRIVEGAIGMVQHMVPSSLGGTPGSTSER
jgi:hypothetical protein